MAVLFWVWLKWFGMGCKKYQLIIKKIKMIEKVYVSWGWDIIK